MSVIWTVFSYIQQEREYNKHRVHALKDDGNDDVTLCGIRVTHNWGMEQRRPGAVNCRRCQAAMRRINEQENSQEVSLEGSPSPV